MKRDTQITEATAFKYEGAPRKLLVAEESITELKNKISVLNTELEKSPDKISRLDYEIISLTSSSDAAIDERNLPALWSAVILKSNAW
ncbi:unnamed protein product [Pieris macdunnoughi]|uniref:Uncharacterized protein n=1 Tax=Pieris macdunnoughi TaxID=345717 RepID=A0A821L7W0_9NEOP|nr:unnamed protein product [Pieris macdunnoughi]